MGMDGKELSTAIAHIGCSGSQIARWLGVTPLTVSRWKNGSRPIPGPAALAIQALSDGWRPKA